MDEPDYREAACKYCGRIRVQASGICEKCLWDNDLNNWVSVTGRCPHSSDGNHTLVPGNNIMGPPFMECKSCGIELPVAGETAPGEAGKEQG